MKYIKTFEYYLFNFGRNKKPDDWYDIEMKLNKIFSDIDLINKLSDYIGIGDREHTTQDHVKNHYDLTNKLKKYDFVVQIDGVYKFDIKKFMKSYSQLVNIDKDDRATFAHLIKFFSGYYRFQKMRHDSRQMAYRAGAMGLVDDIGNEEYVSIFVEDPTFDTTNIMKKINEDMDRDTQDRILMPFADEITHIFHYINQINRLSKEINRLTKTDNRKHNDMKEYLSKYDFIVEIDGVYKFDIKNFMSKSYKQIINIDKGDRIIFNRIMNFFKSYYEREKKEHNDRGDFDIVYNFGEELSEYESPFVEDPTVNVGDVMKKINK